MDIIGLSIGSAVQNIMRITVDRNDIITLFQYIATCITHIIRSHFFFIQRDSDSFRLSRFQEFGFFKHNQIGGSLFDTAIVIGRIVINFNNILTSSVSGIRNGNVELNRIPIIGQIAHLL